MNLNLSELFDNTDQIYKIDGEIESHDLNERLKEGTIKKPIKYSGHIIKETDGYYLDLKVYYTLETNCFRCMIDINKDYEISLSGRLEEYEEETYEEVETDGEIIHEVIDDPIFYDKNGILRLDDYALMEIASSIPMKILCSEDCKGLCKKCGIDLNHETCDCDTDFIDPRLAKLKDFVVED